MPRKSRPSFATSRTSSTRDVPGALYCDPATPDPAVEHGADHAASPEGRDGPTDPQDGTVDVAFLVAGVVAWGRRTTRTTPRAGGRPSFRTYAEITEALRAARGNTAKAAHLLGLPSRMHVHNMLTRHPELWPTDTPRWTEVVGRSRVAESEVLAAWKRTGVVTATADAVGLHHVTVARWLARVGEREMPPRPRARRGGGAASGDGVMVDREGADAGCATAGDVFTDVGTAPTPP